MKRLVLSERKLALVQHHQLALPLFQRRFNSTQAKQPPKIIKLRTSVSMLEQPEMRKPIEEIKSFYKILEEIFSKPPFPKRAADDMRACVRHLDEVTTIDIKELLKTEAGIDISNFDDEFNEEEFEWVKSWFPSLPHPNDPEVAEKAKKAFEKRVSQHDMTKEGQLTLPDDFMKEQSEFMHKLWNLMDKVGKQADEDYNTAAKEYSSLKSLTVHEILENDPKLAAEIEEEVKNHEWFNIYEYREKFLNAKMPPVYDFTDYNSTQPERITDFPDPLQEN